MQFVIRKAQDNGPYGQYVKEILSDGIFLFTSALCQAMAFSAEQAVDAVGRKKRGYNVSLVPVEVVETRSVTALI